MVKVLRSLQLGSRTGFLNSAERRVNDRFGISLQTAHHHRHRHPRSLALTGGLVHAAAWMSLTAALYKRTLHCRASSSPSLTRRTYNAALDRGSALRSTFSRQETDWVGRCDPLPTPWFYMDIKSNKAEE